MFVRVTFLRHVKSDGITRENKIVMPSSYKHPAFEIIFSVISELTLNFKPFRVLILTSQNKTFNNFIALDPLTIIMSLYYTKSPAFNQLHF